MSVVYNLCDDCLHKDTCHGENSDSLMTCFQRKEECTSLNPKTNADRIRNMTDAELAEWFGMSERMCPDGFSETIDCDACPEVCTGHWLLWLKEGVKE